MNIKTLLTILLLSFILLSCGDKEFTVEDVLSWHSRHFNDPVLDSLGYQETMSRADYVMITVDYKDSRLRFIIDKESTLDRFKYSRVLQFDSTTVREFEFPLNTEDFKNAENGAKQIFSYYFNFEKIDIASFENPEVLSGAEKRTFFYFDDKLTLAYSPNNAQNLIEYFSKYGANSDFTQIDNSWYLISR